MGNGEKSNGYLLTKDEKIEYIKKINKNYNYQKSYINFFCNSDYLIYKDFEVEKIQKFDKTTINSLMNLMKKTTNFFDFHNITYWIDCITLLGACRNGKFVP